MNLNPDQVKELQNKIWLGSIPLHITLSPSECRTYNDSLPYLVSLSLKSRLVRADIVLAGAVSTLIIPPIPSSKAP